MCINNKIFQYTVSRHAYRLSYELEEAENYSIQLIEKEIQPLDILYENYREVN